MNYMVRTNFYFPRQMLLRLKEASKTTGLNVSEIVRRAIDDYLRREKQ